jgi:hypothetical protein
MVTGECHWKMRKPSWNVVCLYSITCKDGDVAWCMVHNRIVTLKLLHQWTKRDTDCCPWCPRATGPSITILWNSSVGMLNQLLGPHHVMKKLLLIGCPILKIMSHQLAIYLCLPGVPSTKHGNTQYSEPHTRLQSGVHHLYQYMECHRIMSVVWNRSSVIGCTIHGMVDRRKVVLSDKL